MRPRFLSAFIQQFSVLSAFNISSNAESFKPFGNFSVVRINIARWIFVFSLIFRTASRWHIIHEQPRYNYSWRHCAYSLPAVWWGNWRWFSWTAQCQQNQAYWLISGHYDRLHYTAGRCVIPSSKLGIFVVHKLRHWATCNLPYIISLFLFLCS